MTRDPEAPIAARKVPTTIPAKSRPAAVRLRGSASPDASSGHDAGSKASDLTREEVGPAVQGSGSTTWWYDARGIKDQVVLRAVEDGNCTHMLLDLAQLDLVTTRKQRVVWVVQPAELDDLPPDVWVITSDEAVRANAAAHGHKAGLMKQVIDLQREFPECVALCTRGDDFVVIDIEHATYIPYELLLAKAEETGTLVLRSIPIRGLEKIVGEVDQSLNAMATMEQGVGVLFRSEDIQVLNALSTMLRSRQKTNLELVAAEVIDVRHTGLGHRVCVDTTSLMSAEEGMLVGSTGWGGIFVCSETHLLPHMNLREFRVNAGGVHSYIWAPNGKAIYLSEIEAGSEVLCVNKDGTARVVVVGRAKVERRPLLQITCKVPLDALPEEVREAAVTEALARRRVTPQGESIAGPDECHVYINAFIQNDWHVRVMGADGIVRHGTLIQPGDRILAHVDTPGRHTGLRVTEHIVER